MTQSIDKYTNNIGLVMSDLHIQSAIVHLRKAIDVMNDELGEAGTQWGRYMIRERIKVIKEIIVVLKPDEIELSF